MKQLPLAIFSVLLGSAGLTACGDDSAPVTTAGASSTGTTAADSTGPSTSPATSSTGQASGGGESSSGSADSETSASGTTGNADSGTTGVGSTGSDSGTTTDPETGSSSGSEGSSGSESSGGSVGPGECNELLGAPCPAFQFCDYPDDLCGTGANGTCFPAPGICPAIFDPHCGCDGATHSSSCDANAAGTDIDYPGPC